MINKVVDSYQTQKPCEENEGRKADVFILVQSMETSGFSSACVVNTGSQEVTSISNRHDHPPDL